MTFCGNFILRSGDSNNGEGPASDLHLISTDLAEQSAPQRRLSCDDNAFRVTFMQFQASRVRSQSESMGGPSDPAIPGEWANGWASSSLS